jgi:FKBP-type peptidyl-prolyl cis-trans isomerase 2
LDDGTVFDASEKHGEPLEFEVGAGAVIPGFEKAVLGMEKGEEKKFTIPAKEAYGEPDPNLVKKIPKDKLEGAPDLEVGMALVMNLPNGASITASVVEVGDDTVTFDMNHPLAGKDLTFEIKIVEIA